MSTRKPLRHFDDALKRVREEGRMQVGPLKDEMKEKIQELGREIQEGSAGAVKQLDDEVRKRPWLAVALASVLGLLFGVILGFRMRRK